MTTTHKPNKVYESAQLDEISIQVAEFLKTADLSKMYDFYIDCMNIDHVDFVIKGHYMRGQISTILDHIKIGDAYFGVDKGSLLFECMYTSSEVGLKLYKITNDGYVKVENAI